jgi:uncharacterized cupin superfamily protein
LKVTRIYADAAGDSHFGELDIPLKDGGTIGRLSECQPVNTLIFRETDADYNYDWHCAPQRQYVVLLDGEIELETSDGEKRRFRGGDILLVEDVGGRGHRTRTVNNTPRRSMFVTLE